MPALAASSNRRPEDMGAPLSAGRDTWEAPGGMLSPAVSCTARMKDMALTSKLRVGVNVFERVLRG
ncbi:hypothetical protein GCM10012319_16000 [Comamonas sp. KCTC 72670]|nr:hypothetical protein GCM10012319_16000 [Comamonas sp. KCTC 72670]